MSHVLRVVNPYFPERGFSLSEIVDHLNTYVRNHQQNVSIRLSYAYAIRKREELEVISQVLDKTYIEVVDHKEHAVNPLALKFLPIKERLLYQAICEYCVPQNKLTCLATEIRESYEKLINLNNLKTSRVAFHNYLHNLERVGLLSLKVICYTTTEEGPLWIDDSRDQNHRACEITLHH